MVLNVIAQKTDMEKDFPKLQEASAVYAFEDKQAGNFDVVAEADLFDENKINRQWHFFYNDWDGVASFELFVQTYKNLKWALKDNEKFIILTGRKNGRTIEIYANKPGYSESGRDEIADLLKDKTVQYMVHRGHSPHLPRTMPFIRSTAKVVFLGSCGGARSVSEVIFLSPESQALATRGTGTREINNYLLTEINSQMLDRGSVDWDVVWKKADAQFKSDGNWKNYQRPDDNRSLQFIRQYRKHLDADNAMFNQDQKTGGIDLNTINLKTSGQAMPVDVSADPAQLKMNIPGLVPQIISIQSVNLLSFLGLEQGTDSTPSDAQQAQSLGLDPFAKPESI